jgi:hypothetical protein
MSEVESKAVWTAELIDEAVALYIERIEALEEDKRSENTVQITTDIANELGFKPNSVRVRLSKAKRPDGSDVYVRKVRAKTAGTATPSAGGSAKRVSKADAQAELVNALKQVGAPVSDELAEVISKLTGKAAQALAVSLGQVEE